MCICVHIWGLGAVGALVVGLGLGAFCRLSTSPQGEERKGWTGHLPSPPVLRADQALTLLPGSLWLTPVASVDFWKFFPTWCSISVFGGGGAKGPASDRGVSHPLKLRAEWARRLHSSTPFPWDQLGMVAKGEVRGSPWLAESVDFLTHGGFVLLFASHLSVSSWPAAALAR